jgi:O-methyltransferase
MLRRVSELHPEIDIIHANQKKAYSEIQDTEFWKLFELAAPFSMVHATGFYNLFQSLRYIRDNDIKGDLVECGCALGGVAIFMKLLLNEWAMRRTIYLFDTFVGPPVGSHDVIYGGKTLHWTTPMSNHRAGTEQNIRDVVGSLDGFEIVEGFVENTLPKVHIGQLALLRLDTDFYESTKIEFEILYPKLAPGGVLIIDDYGYFSGSRKATDEYLATLRHPPLINRIDQGVWAGVKPDNRLFGVKMFSSKAREFYYSAISQTRRFRRFLGSHDARFR